jgi:protein tyrosine phosphatase
LDKYPGEDILVHCAAGVSRSPALVKFMIDYFGYTQDLELNGSPDAFKCHNTQVYYTLKRAILDHPNIQKRLKEANQ